MRLHIKHYCSGTEASKQNPFAHSTFECTRICEYGIVFARTHLKVIQKWKLQIFCESDSIHKNEY